MRNLYGFFLNRSQNQQMSPVLRLRGFEIYEGWLDRSAQQELVVAIRAIAQAAPLIQPVTPSGKQMSVRMTSAGQYGWVTDMKGYRYTTAHPDGEPWPAIPKTIMDIWDAIAQVERRPECCLINYYDADARMGLHQDRDEANFKWPVVSVSLGDDALFRVGNETRGGSTESIWLRSGDVVLMGGPARLTYHGVDRIKAGTSTLLSNGGRINLTLRVVK